jgi:hypothetical protein
MWAAPVTVTGTQTSDLQHGMKDIADWLTVSTFIEVMLISFFGFSEMKICNVIVL